MADSASRAQRAASIEEKRRKLEELKKTRSRRSEDTQRLKQAASSNLDEYIDGLLTSHPAATPTESSSSKISDENKDEPNPTTISDGETEIQSGTTMQATKALAYSDTASTSPSLTDGVTTEAVNVLPIPKMIETFTVSTQTEDDDFPEKGPILPSDVYDGEDQSGDKISECFLQQSSELKLPTNEISRVNEMMDGRETLEPKLLSESQIQKEVRSHPFSSFLNAASKKVERVLETPLFSDLMTELGVDDCTSKTTRAKGKETDRFSHFISSQMVLECPGWTNERDITDLDWSPLHREMILTTHNSHSSFSSTSWGSQANSTNTVPADATAPSSSLQPRRSENLKSAGVAAVWSLNLPTRPEHLFTSGSPITAGRFHPSESSLILGGLESGQLVVWDVRVGRLPVQKSALSSTSFATSALSSTPTSFSKTDATQGHTYPLTNMEILEGGLGLATSSIDGRLNFWSFASLREPIESIQIGHSISCFTVLPESGGYMVGDDHGSIYIVGSLSTATADASPRLLSHSAGATSSTSNIISGMDGQQTRAKSANQSSSSNRKQVRKLEPVVVVPTSSADTNREPGSSTEVPNDMPHHFGMMTALSAKVLKGSTSTAAYSRTNAALMRGSGGLVLSAGIDWTIKLWAPAYTTTQNTNQLSPLWSTVSHSYDYMSDVKWSPVHPGLFATSSTNGCVGLWNLATSLDEPLTGADGLSLVNREDSSDGGLATENPVSSEGKNAFYGNKSVGLNKLSWSSDGRKLAVAKTDNLHLLTLQEDVARPKGDEDEKIMNELVSRGLITRY